MRETLASARPGQPAEKAAQPLPEGIRRILESHTFERAPTLRTLLTYLWERRDEAIGEYAIATEALGRSPSFDAKTDATVRVQISRLRQRLDKFYEEEGKFSTERVAIPLGAHQVNLETVTVPDPTPAQTIAEFPPHRLNRLLVWACVGLAALSAALGLALYRTAGALRADTQAVAPHFWKAFFGTGRQTRIILPTPVFFSYRRADATVMLRDTAINEFADRNQSPVPAGLERKFGPPTLAQNYTVASDTFAAVRLVRYLDRFSLLMHVRSSADAPVEALDSENIIAIGTWGTLTPLNAYLDRMSLRLQPNERTIEIRGAGPGQPHRIDAVDESPSRGVWPGVVALLPGPSGKTHLLILASRHTSALVSTLTTGDALSRVERLWQSKGSPPFFEMVVNSEMEDGEMVRSWPVLLRPFARNTP
jgi:hypothetical protein